MKSMHIRNLSERTLRLLKRRAERHRRSLQKEVETLLEEAAEMTIEEGEFGDRFDLHFVSSLPGSSTWSRAEIYEDSDGR